MFTMAERTEKANEKKGEKNMKTPEQETSKQKKLTQLNLKSVPLSVRNSVVSDKLPNKKPRTSSGEMSPNGASEVIDTGELKIIQESLREIKDTMVKKSDIKDIVSAILSELKGEIKEEIISEIKGEIKGEIKQEFETKLEEKAKHFELQSKEIADGLNLDLETLREKFHAQSSEFRRMSQQLKQCLFTAESALKLSNNNQQYSQKNNIKFTNWGEGKTENLREDLIKILRTTVGLDLDPTDILEIHRIPGGAQKGPRPVIAKFRNSETKIKIIRKRQNDQLKKHFHMHDHLTTMNGRLIYDLNKDERIDQAWYFNGKVFALDKKGKRHRFEILDNFAEKLRARSDT
ncbi:uncharacterized protein LOC144619735 [Crassostrea virginica]